MSIELHKRQEILRELAALDEKQRRMRTRRASYVPTPGQKRFLVSPAKNRFNFSGNGGGKTAMNVQISYHACKGKNPWTGEITKVPAKIAFVVDTSRKIEERIIPELNKWFEIKPEQFAKEGKPYISKYYDRNGSEITYLTADADPMSFEGVEYDWVIIDEPIPRILYIALKRSLRKKGAANRFVFSGTAITQAWLRKEIFEPWKRGELPDTECFTLRTEDNAVNLEADYILNFGRTLTDAEKRVRLEGGFFDADTLALAEFLKPEHLVDDKSFEYDYRMPCVTAIDPHSAKPHTAVMIAIDRNDRPIALKELTFRGNATQFAAELKKMEEGYRIVDRVCDSLGSMEMTSGEGMHSFIDGLRLNGITVRATTFKEKSHEDLIDRLRNGLAIPEEPDEMGRVLPKIRLHKDGCPRLIRDIEQATWQKNRMTGEVVAKLDTSTKDYLSCFGYALALNIGYDTSNTIEVHYVVRKDAEGKRDEAENKAIVKRREKVIMERQDRRRQRFFSRRFG